LTGVKPEAKWVMFHCADGYTAPVPLEDAMVEGSLIAFKINGKPIPVQQGFPARPFIPHLYGWKSAKWLTGIGFLADYEDGYWKPTITTSEAIFGMKNASKAKAENTFDT